MPNGMFIFNGFTKKANTAINEAINIATSLGHDCIGSEHILYGLAVDSTSVAAILLQKSGITKEFVLTKLQDNFDILPKSSLDPNDLTPRSKRILDNSINEARLLEHKFVGTEHILLAILQESDSYAVSFIQDAGISCKSMYSACIAEISNSQSAETPIKSSVADPQQKRKKSNSAEYGKDLTELARNNSLDPVIGRNDEIERVIQILSRRTKNNPCLVGEPGVGKTAVVEGLAQKIATGEVPETIKDKKIISLDLTAMLAGAKYRGEFEERIKKVIDNVISQKDIILFIDELHNIIGAGAAEGAIDAANILKPQLARGEIQLIGATTNDEYRKYIEKDAALERRFQPVMVNEPSPEDAVNILLGLRDKYESHHKIKITNEAVRAAVTMSARYITDRFLPDKAIDLIDEAASRVRLKAFTSPDGIKELENQIKDLSCEKAAAINSQDFEMAARYRDLERDITIELEKQKLDWAEKRGRATGEVCENDIAEIVSSWTGIPLKQLTEQEGKRLLDLENILHERIVGQEPAISAIANAIRRGRVGLKDPKRPIGSFMFLGPTGVGKTEVCKALAEVLFGDENAIIRLDMSEYMEKHAVSKLIGSPPGYVGFDAGGQFTEKIRRKPYSVILFDEIEKAHPDIFNILLQIFEDGTLTDAQGRKIDFKNTAIIMTSNIGARLIIDKKSLGFIAEKSDEVDTSGVLKELKKHFRPELLNRLDEIIIFHKLTETDIEQIAVKMLDSFIERAATLEFTLRYTQAVAKKISAIGFDQLYGARPLRRAITSNIEDALSQRILEGNLKKKSEIVIDVENDEIVFVTKDDI